MWLAAGSTAVIRGQADGRTYKYDTATVTRSNSTFRWNPLHGEQNCVFLFPLPRSVVHGGNGMFFNHSPR